MILRRIHIGIAMPFFPMAYILIISVLVFLCALPVTGKAQQTVKKTTRTPVYTKEGSASCLFCHSGEKIRAISTSPHGNAQTPETPAAKRGCESCHGPGSIHISRAHGGKGFPPLTRFGRPDTNSPREEQLQACLSCHGDINAGETQIVFVGSPHDRSNINCSTCHTMHVETDPINGRETQTRTCNRCHRRVITEHPRFVEKGIDFDALNCSACHDVHTPVEPHD